LSQTRLELEGLNFLLHGASVLGLELDPPNRLTAISLKVTTVPKRGPAVTLAKLRLEPVKALAVTLQTREGRRPRGAMAPVRLDGLSGLASGAHPLVGFDFIDSKRDAESRGRLVFEWADADPRSAHVLSFYFGLLSAEREPALLFFRVFFDQATLSYSDGREIPIESFAPSGTSTWKALGFGDTENRLSPIKVLPDPVPPERVDRESLALAFIDTTDTMICAYTVGEARWDGRDLRWLGPDGVIYDLPQGRRKTFDQGSPR
jgi:hypothetical protein